jgi:hypothetical protein
MRVKHSWMVPFAAIVAKNGYEYVGLLFQGRDGEKDPGYRVPAAVY